MARMIYKRDSATMVLNIVRRFIRLCSQNPLGAPFIISIQPPTDILKSKDNLLQTAIENREDALDDIRNFDSDLNDTVKNTFDTWKTYMRKHPVELNTLGVFPNGTFSKITRSKYTVKPNIADALATRIESLENTHELYPLAATIRENTAIVRTGLKNHTEMIRLQKLAEVEVLIAKVNVARAYEVNYLEARKQLGTVVAEKLFPRILTKSKGDTIEK